ncbi:TIGR01777 family oxidoreductase [Halalkalibacillus halophilus]|uniref:TIGR01777 family oxidoreductase n=1 Tax=Halalkalibacillus halophilus TaxID=392827 RepID=UPI000404F5E6|nr:TIGR01777 family oxidoreductase [Halalkalibacillus halophilus]
MRILIAGGTGFVGRRLVDHFTAKDDEIYILTRNPDKYDDNEPNVKYIEWLTPNSQPELELEAMDVCINLAGESLASGRWTEERKKSILESRISTTREFIRIMGALRAQPRVYINASAVGFYGNSETNIYTEDTIIPGDDFLAEVCNVWENEVDEAKQLGIRTIKTRFGLILDGEEGALPNMALPYKLFGGGRLGNGEQWMSWIHIDDVINAMEFIIHKHDVEDVVNFTAPYPRQNKEFGKELADALNRPHWIPAPSFAIRTILGDMADLLLQGQYVYPKKLEEHGYEFIFPDLRSALQDIY